MSDTTRKAIITNAQVQEALSKMNTLREEIGLPVLGTEFDKGARGKGFAVYTKDGQTVETFDMKEVAYIQFSAFVKIGNEVLGAPHVKVVKPTAKATEKDAA